MHLLARGAKLKLTITANAPTPKRWEVWPNLANLEVSQDGRSVEVSFLPVDLGMGRFTVLAHQSDGKPATHFYLKAVAAPGEVPAEPTAPLKSRIRPIPAEAASNG